MSTSPWAADSLNAANSSYTIVCGVAVYLPGRTEPLSLGKTINATIEYDGRRSPRVTGTAVVGWPTASVRSALDPRRALTIRIRAGYKQYGYSDVQTMGTFRVTDVVQDYIAQTVTLTFASDEFVVIQTPIDSNSAPAEGDDKIAAIKSYVGAAFPGETLTWALEGVSTKSEFGNAQAFRYGDDRWDAVNDWCEGLKAKAFSLGKNKWYLEKVTYKPTANPVARLRTGPAGTVTDLKIKDSRNGYCNQVMVIYEHRSGSTTTTTSVLAKTSLTPIARTVVKRKGKPENAKEVARHALRRGLRRGHSIELTSSAYLWVRPGDTITVDIPGPGQDRLLVEKVTFDLIKGTMAVTGQNTTDDIDAGITVTVQENATTT